MEKLIVYGKDVCHSLSRSAVRRDVLLFLLARETATIADIAKGIRSNYTNVQLAIYGDGDRYRVRLSLVKLELVVLEKITSNLQVYCLTPMGKDVAKTLREITYDRDF